MIQRETLLLYCQHSVGIGHLTRSLALAAAFAERYRVVFLNGGPIPAGLPVPAGVEIVDLPPLGTRDGHTLVSRDAATTVTDAQARRRAVVLATFAATAPAVVVIELFPFGRKKFAFELLPLLRAARAARAGRPLVVCSVRDILVNARPDQQRHDDRAAWLCRRYFDAVLIHSDPRLMRFDESFAPRRPPGVPMLYTGFVAPRRAATAAVSDRSGILVSAGGGSVGMPLMRCALDARRLLAPATTRPGMLRLVAGPFLPEEEWLELQHLAAAHGAVELLRQVPNLSREMRGAAVSVSQCGYNTALDIIESGVPALVVPYAAGREDEQTSRAGRMAALGLLRWLPAGSLTPASLAAAIDATLGFRPAPNALALDGAARSLELIERMKTRRGTGGFDAAPQTPWMETARCSAG